MTYHQNERMDKMKKALSKMNIKELRELAVKLGADEKKLFGTSKTAMVVIINRLEKEVEAEA